MARALWTGSIAFGLVHVPVELFTATKEHRPRFHRLDKASKQRVHHKRVTAGGKQEVEYGDTVKGFEVARGRHVVLSDEELAAALPEQHRRIEIEQFVELTELDPLLWRKAYFVAPSQNGKADRPYLLLRRAMEDSGLVGIARIVLRSREYLVTLRPFEKALVMHTMYFADEIVGLDKLRHLPSEQRVPAKELELASRLIESLAAPFDHAKYKDEYQQRVLALVRKKSEGKEIAVDRAEAEGAPVIDLMEALKQSLGAKRSKPKGGPRKTAARRKRKAS